jgi:hypothetical protein
MDRLGAAWRNYRIQVMALDAPAIQARECRRAYYAGASALLGLLLEGVGEDPDEPATLDEIALMEAIHQELQQFARAIEAGNA